MRKRIKYNDQLVLLLILITCVLVYRILYSLFNDVIVLSLDDSLSRYKREYDEINNIYYKYPKIRLHEEDYKFLIDQKFEFEILDKKICDENTFLLIYVHSAPENFEKRRLIRETWGKYMDEASLLFALGSVESPSLQKKIQEEYKNHGDIVQGSFKDTYKNLTYKHVMLFKYTIYHCEHAKYVLKTDDDIFINVDTLVSFLQEKISDKGALNFIFCLPNNGKVIRSYRYTPYSKWKVSYKDYPENKYPPSCVGIFIVYSKNVIFELYMQAQKSGYFWIDDIYITGSLLKKLNIYHVNAKKYMVNQKRMKVFIPRNDVEPWPFFFCGPDLNATEMRWLNVFLKNKGS